MKNFIFTLPLLFVLTSCLKTRRDVVSPMNRDVGGPEYRTSEERTSSQNSSGQSMSATKEEERPVEVNEELRALHGRIEVLENSLQQSQQAGSAGDQKYEELNKKLNLYQEELSKMEAQIAGLQAENSKLQAETSSGSKSDKNDKSSDHRDRGSDKNSVSGMKAEKIEPKNKSASFNQAEEAFKQKDWKKAILTYQKYRDDNPKGAKFAESTYKIGVSFQELGLKDEAKTFYDEVLTRYPQSDVAKKAKYRLSQMKK